MNTANQFKSSELESFLRSKLSIQANSQKHRLLREACRGISNYEHGHAKLPPSQYKKLVNRLVSGLGKVIDKHSKNHSALAAAAPRLKEGMQFIDGSTGVWRLYEQVRGLMGE